VDRFRCFIAIVLYSVKPIVFSLIFRLPKIDLSMQISQKLNDLSIYIIEDVLFRTTLHKKNVLIYLFYSLWN